MAQSLLCTPVCNKPPLHRAFIVTHGHTKMVCIAHRHTHNVCRIRHWLIAAFFPGSLNTATKDASLLMEFLTRNSVLVHDESDWVKLAAQGDRNAFAQLVQRYWEPLRRWMVGLTGQE